MISFFVCYDLLASYFMGQYVSLQSVTHFLLWSEQPLGTYKGFRYLINICSAGIKRVFPSCLEDSFCSSQDHQAAFEGSVCNRSAGSYLFKKVLLTLNSVQTFFWLHWQLGLSCFQVLFSWYSVVVPLVLFFVIHSNSGFSHLFSQNRRLWQLL